MKNLITRKMFYSVFLLSGLFAMLTNSASAQPGSLDTSFGTGGKVTTNVSSADDEILASAVQSDNKIVVVGYSNSPAQFTITRYTASGGLDTTFGTGGTAQTSFNNPSFARAVAIQSDGKIVVGGNAGNSFALSRYTSSGQLDTGFGNQGKVLTSIGNLSVVNAIAVQSDGKIVAVGFTEKSSDFAVARYTAGGVLDTSFNGNGIVVTDFANDIDQATSVKIQSDGKILVAGSAVDADLYTTFALARYDTNGSLDTAFDGDGMVTTVTDCGAEALGIQTDGKIVVTGSLDDVYLARYATDGSLDSTFGTNGLVTTNVAGYDTAYDLVIDSMGKILVGGSTLSGGNEDMFVTRYQTNGLPDDTFDNGDGSVIISFGTNSDIAYSLSLQSGRIIVAGSKGNFGAKEFAVARLLGFQPTAASATISGRITAGNRGVASVRVARTDSQGNTTYAITNPFGYYSFYNQTVGQTYILSPNHKSYTFTPSSMVISLLEDYDQANFSAQ